MDVQAYCQARLEAQLDFPFGPDASVYRVKHKIFAIHCVQEGRVPSINLKCEPEQALALRDIFSSITPAYHMNKKHWNTVVLDGNVPAQEIERLIDLSYTLVVRGLSRSDRQDLERRHPVEQLYR